MQPLSIGPADVDQGDLAGHNENVKLCTSANSQIRSVNTTARLS